MQGKNNRVAALILQGYTPEVHILIHVCVYIHTCQKRGGEGGEAS